MLRTYIHKPLPPTVHLYANTHGVFVTCIGLSSPQKKVLGFMPALYGFGLTLGPILGGVVSKYGGPRMAFGAAALVAGLQLVNIMRLKETLRQVRGRL